MSDERPPKDDGSPGSHPHADQPNWRPADNFEDFLRNCREGLEQASDRRAAKLLGVSRAELWRWKLMAELPEGLFDALLRASNKPTTTQLGKVALALRDGRKCGDAEYCPHCGGLLRVRLRVPPVLQKVVDEWLSNGGAP